MSTPDAVQKLVSAGRLERVPADLPTAQTRLERAAEKLASAKSIAEIDVEVAYVTAYDAARIAVTAHMLANGYRAKPIARAHEAVSDYAEALIDSPSAAQFHALRRRRNKAEYDDIVLSRADFDTDLVHAEAIITAIRDTLGTKPRTISASLSDTVPGSDCWSGHPDGRVSGGVGWI